MKEILEKLEEWFNDTNLGEDKKVSTRYQYADNITWKELYQLYEFAKASYTYVEAKATCEAIIKSTYNVTVVGDCGKVHHSFAEWQSCSDCDTIMKKHLRGIG